MAARRKENQMPQTGLDLQEQIARIEREQAHIHQLYASHDRLRQEIWWQPLLFGAAGMGAGAAFFAAGIAFIKLIGA
jgi:hypothetical protein